MARKKNVTAVKVELQAASDLLNTELVDLRLRLSQDQGGS